MTVLSNQRYNSYLKEVAEITGIDKNLTTHIARKTFASTVLLYNDVPTYCAFRKKTVHVTKMPYI